MGPKSYEEGLRQMFLSLGGLRAASETHSAPDGHARVDEDRRPQDEADETRAETGGAEDESRAYIIEQH